MKIVYGLMALFGLHVIDVGAVRKEDNLKAPRLKTEWSLNGPRTRLEWTPVKELGGNPIIGYRLKVWELTKKVNSYENVDGEQKLVTKTVPLSEKERYAFDYTTVVPKWIIDVEPNVTKAEFGGIEYDIFYEKRVQALTLSEEGPLSGPSTTAVVGPKKTDENN